MHNMHFIFCYVGYICVFVYLQFSIGLQCFYYIVLLHTTRSNLYYTHWTLLFHSPLNLFTVYLWFISICSVTVLCLLFYLLQAISSKYSIILLLNWIHKNSLNCQYNFISIYFFRNFDTFFIFHTHTNILIEFEWMNFALNAHLKT